MTLMNVKTLKGSLKIQAVLIKMRAEGKKKIRAEKGRQGRARKTKVARFLSSQLRLHLITFRLPHHNS